MAEKKQYMRPTPQNRGLEALAEGLRRAREGLNYVPLPEVLGGGAGNLLFGESPEEIEAWSYGSSPFKENPSASIIPIEVRPGREQRLLDTAFLPAAEAYGLAKLAGAGVRRGVQGALSGATQQGRREFLKKAGHAAAGTAATASAPDLVRNIGKELAPTAAKTVARATSPEKFIDSVWNIVHTSYRKANDAVDNMSAEQIIDYYRKNRLGTEKSIDEPVNIENINAPLDDEYGGYSIGQVKVAEHLQDRIYRDEIAKLLKDPKFAPYADHIEDIGPESLDWQRAAAMKEMEKIYKTTQKASGGMIENTTHDRKII